MGDDDSVVSGADVAGTIGLMVTVGALSAGLAVAGEPSGAGIAAALITGGIVELNIRNPMPYLEASQGWHDLLVAFGNMKGNLSRLNADVDSTWQGEAADQFKNFTLNHIVPAVDGLMNCARLSASACTALFGGMLTSIIAYITATAAAIVACIAANATGPFSPAVKWAIVAGWTAAVVAILAALAAFITSVATASDSAAQAYAQLALGFGLDGDRLDTKSVDLPEAQRLLFTDPQKWNKQKG
jgi:hypothetical protein